MGDDDGTIEDAVSTNSNKVNRRKAKILRRKLLKKYMKLRRIIDLIEKKFSVREKKFIKLNKFVKLNGPVGNKRFTELISEVDGQGPHRHARGRKMRRGHATKCHKSARICCDGTTPRFDRNRSTPQCEDGTAAKCSQKQCTYAPLV